MAMKAQCALILLILTVFLSATSPAAERPQEPHLIRYHNEILGVYVGERLPNGKTRIILHRKDRGSPEVHFVNGVRVEIKGSRPSYGYLIGEVVLGPNKPLDVYSGVVRVDAVRKKENERLIRAFRASGKRPFRLEVSQIDQQAKKLIEKTSRLDKHTDYGKARPYVKLLYLMGKPAHPDLLNAYLGGNDFAGTALNLIGAAAQADVSTIWKDQSETNKWKLMNLKVSVEKKFAVPFAIKSLDSRTKDIRWKAIRWLGKHKTVQARSPLLRKLNVEVPRLRWDIVDALTKIGGEDVVDAFIKLLAPDSWAAKGQGLVHPPGFTPYWWPDGREHIIRALGKLKAARSAPALLKILREKGEGKAYLGEFIIPLLGEFHYAKAIPQLERILTTPDLGGFPKGRPSLDPKATKAKVNRLTARALCQLGDTTGCDLLSRELKAGHWAHRRFAAETFARFGTKEDVPLLAGCLRDRDSQVLRWVCRGLERITGTVRRKKGWAECTENDSGLWLVWWQEHSKEYRRKGP